MDSSVSAGKRISKIVTATVIALTLIVTIFASVALASDNGVEVDILDGAQEITVTTTESEPSDILAEAGITLGADDKVDFSGFEKGKGGQIVVKRLNSVNISFAGNINSYDVYSATVGEALKELGVALGSNDTLNYALTDAVQDGMVISVKSANSVKLVADGKKTSYVPFSGTVAQFLKFAGVTLGSEDYTQPSLTSTVKSGTEVKVFRVEYKNITKTKKVKFKTKKVKDKKMDEGTTKVVTKGKNGKKTVSYRVKYVNGKKVATAKVGEKINKKAVRKVVKVGTKKVNGTKDTAPNGVKSMNGFRVGQKINGSYTHYCACATCNGNSNGITTSGKRIQNGMANPYYIACNWLPLGSVINVDGTNYLVVDRGGSGLSRVGRIDIFTPEGHAECYRLGVGSCDITIVRLGW